MRIPCGLIAVMLASPAAAATARATATVAPETVWLVPAPGALTLDFDIMVSNDGDVPLAVSSVAMLAFDARGELVTARELNGMGLAPALRTLAYTEVAPGRTIPVFNPFHHFPPDLDLALLRYTITLEAEAPAPAAGDRPGGPAPPAPVSVELDVHPKPVAVKTALSLPIEGPALVWDGNDFYAHHRRFDLTHPFVVESGIRHNISRYGLDFMETDAAGRRFRGKGDKVEDYLVYGRPVLAPAAGTVLKLMDGRRDSPVGEMTVDYDEFMRTKDLELFGGNFLVLDHGNGEYSYFAHLRPGSFKVAKGDQVAAGQVLAQVGNSGDSMEPHLHYHLLSRPQLDCALIPPVFRNYGRFVGGRWVAEAQGSINTGDVVRAIAGPGAGRR